jgi:hypothetical protein
MIAALSYSTSTTATYSRDIVPVTQNSLSRGNAPWRFIPPSERACDGTLVRNLFFFLPDKKHEKQLQKDGGRFDVITLA